MCRGCRGTWSVWDEHQTAHFSKSTLVHERRASIFCFNCLALVLRTERATRVFAAMGRHHDRRLPPTAWPPVVIALAVANIGAGLASASLFWHLSGQASVDSDGLAPVDVSGLYEANNERRATKVSPKVTMPQCSLCTAKPHGLMRTTRTTDVSVSCSHTVVPSPLTRDTVITRQERTGHHRRASSATLVATVLSVLSFR